MLAVDMQPLQGNPDLVCMRGIERLARLYTRLLYGFTQKANFAKYQLVSRQTVSSMPADSDYTRLE